MVIGIITKVTDKFQMNVWKVCDDCYSICVIKNGIWLIDESRVVTQKQYNKILSKVQITTKEETIELENKLENKLKNEKQKVYKGD